MNILSDCNTHPHLAQMKVSDTSTAESGSELEEMASPKTNMNSHVPKLTPVSENVSLLIYTSDIKNVESCWFLLDLTCSYVYFRSRPMIKEVLLFYLSMKIVCQWLTKLWMLLGSPKRCQMFMKVRLVKIEHLHNSKA